ncbi:U-scoloptoxin(05)-Sm1a-like isoform X2 [Pollicipes pollicipes]|uniref:U-scoloptoxin(05)-Sm1a-like n=1 Tax=Pollicipes pollicipes TaxID=41117 RepID=UPI001884CAC0|nr:U-scoloptoxin(05)-Sm1a-like [Pollicipes pollicipes]XP_037073092.1 U-scoloptoxin(05)-Sm1a-like isoform X2 [Pollicipes pollicipes]XP_037073164.1 U-scoloptoxin(05)-Sm1a-like isoform X2 [Pollicipes pollicipes]
MARDTVDGMMWVLMTFLALGLRVAPASAAIQCYVCDSSSQIGCAEFLSDTSLLEPQSCDNVYGAQYCVKMTQVFEGQLGTKRFCSSRNFGDYCEWVKRPGDANTYQACVLTCGTSACNSSASLRGAALLVAMTTVFGLVCWLQVAR